MNTILANSVVDTVGNTPLIKLNRIAQGLHANVYVKCEFYNPLFSVKDRIGKAMIEAAERDGKLGPGEHRGRTNIGKYGNRACLCVCLPRLSVRAHDAGNNVG